MTGGADDLNGALTPNAHAASHQNGGSDEIDVTGLTGAGGGTPTLVGAKAKLSAAQSIPNSGEEPVNWDGTDDWDTDGFHFTSAANLTGTVAKTSGSPNIVGTGTSFTTELTVNQVISIPGTATEIGVVKTITDNTNLVLWRNMANTATGQTAARRNEYMAIPLGKDGYYDIHGALGFASASNQLRYARINANRSGTDEMIGIGGTSPGASSASYAQVYGKTLLAAGDYVWLNALQASGTNPLALNTGLGTCWFELEFRYA